MLIATIMLQLGRYQLLLWCAHHDCAWCAVKRKLCVTYCVALDELFAPLLSLKGLCVASGRWGSMPALLTASRIRCGGIRFSAHAARRAPRWRRLPARRACDCRMGG